MGGNVERHIGDDDRYGAAIEVMRDAEPTSDDVSFQDRDEALAQVASLTPDDLIDLIGEFGREVYHLLDDCETSGPVGEEIHTITEDGLRKVSAILDRIDDLPFEEPGVILGTGAMLQAAIMQTFAPPAPPSETVTEAQIDAIAVVLSKRIYKQTEGEWQPSSRQADELARVALRALKGDA